MNKALIIIDPQNDYFPGGAFPLERSIETLDNILLLMNKANHLKQHIIIVQHIGSDQSLFFRPDCDGVSIHKLIIESGINATYCSKNYADSFYKTELSQILENYSVDEIFICGMMTQNCITHTALSKSANKFSINIIGDACTTVSTILHKIAISALGTSVNIINTNNFLDKE